MIVSRIAAISVLLGGLGCATSTRYTPLYVAQNELVLSYNDRLQISAGHEPLTEAPGFDGLADYVRCHDRASAHAKVAETKGAGVTALRWVGGTLGVTALGGLSGVAYIEKDRRLAIGLLAGGAAIGVVAMLIAGAARSFAIDANGNAVDAVNYYNDAVGSNGEGCTSDASQ